MIKRNNTNAGHPEDACVFIELERLFISKGHSANRATELAYEAVDMLNDWYDEKMEDEDVN